MQNLDPARKDTKAPLLLAIKEVRLPRTTLSCAIGALRWRFLQFIETAERKAVEPYAPMLIHSVRTFVESLQQPELLLPSVEVLVVLCQTQGQHFTPHFQVACKLPINI
jgi:hypothetical protein